MVKDVESDLCAKLNQSRAIYVEAGKLLQLIGAARTLADVQRAADRAEGFALGLAAARVLITGA